MGKTVLKQKAEVQAYTLHFVQSQDLSEENKQTKTAEIWSNCSLRFLPNVVSYTVKPQEFHSSFLVFLVMILIF